MRHNKAQRERENNRCNDCRTQAIILKFRGISICYNFISFVSFLPSHPPLDLDGKKIGFRHKKRETETDKEEGNRYDNLKLENLFGKFTKKILQLCKLEKKHIFNNA